MFSSIIHHFLHWPRSNISGFRQALSRHLLNVETNGSAGNFCSHRISCCLNNPFVNSDHSFYSNGCLCRRQCCGFKKQLHIPEKASWSCDKQIQLMSVYCPLFTWDCNICIRVAETFFQNDLCHFAPQDPTHQIQVIVHQFFDLFILLSGKIW